METLFSDYAKLDAESKAIEAKKVLLKTELLAKMHQEKMEKAETLYGKFTIGSRLSWIYSPKIDKLTESLKMAKIKEEQKGTAKHTTSEFLVFTAPKL